MADKYSIALAGNPNCGKTTLFNELTGSNGYVGNWPGVTVEKKQAAWRADKTVEFVDLPGIYSLSPYSPEEVVSRDYLVSSRPHAVIDLLDATNLERNLYLTTQILECGLPVVVGLNMCDLLAARGETIDTQALSEMLGAPVVQVSALRNTNLDALVTKAVEAGKQGRATAGTACFSPEVEDALAKIAPVVANHCPSDLTRWYAIKVFERDAEAIAPLALSKEEVASLEPLIEAVEKDRDDDAESIITSDRYDWIDQVMQACVKKAPKKLTVTEMIDRVVTNRFLGLIIFALIMWGVYYLAVTIGVGPVTDWANDGVFGEGWDFFGMQVPGIPVLVENGLNAVGASAFTKSLVLDGIVAGVGAILGFVPQMVVLFVLLCFLEDCGYMARVAFVMDRVFRQFGLSGKSFIPILISSGCGVPGVMATKTIENEKDRRMTTMVTTFVPCGAKLPIISLLMGALIGGTDAAWIAPLFYFLGVAAVIVSAVMLKKTKPFQGEPAPFVMELPDYHFPSIKSWMLHVWERVRSYIVKAGTIIFASSAIVWFLSNFGTYPGASFGWLPETSRGAADFMSYSLLAGLGGMIAWIFAPLGFGNWQAAAMTVTGLIAKENVVATFATLFQLGEATEEDPALWAAFSQMFTYGHGAMMAFVAFNMLCAPCFAAMGTIRKQMDDPKWFWAAIGYECGFGWVVGLIIYNLYELFVHGVFGPWTLVAFVALAALLFQIFRPMPKWDKADDKIVADLSDSLV